MPARSDSCDHNDANTTPDISKPAAAASFKIILCMMRPLRRDEYFDL